MEALLTNVNWVGVIIGFVLSFALGALWYSPKMFGRGWMKAAGIDESECKNYTKNMVPAMITQALGIFGYAWIIGVTTSVNSYQISLLAILTIALLIKSNGLFSKKGKYAIYVEAGFIFAIGAIMMLVQWLL